MSKKAKAEYAQKMKEVETFVKENNIKQAQNGKSFYFELNGKKYRVSNHTVEASNAGAFNSEGQQVRELYHPDSRDGEVQIFASPTRIIDIYNAIKEGKQVDGRGRVAGEEYNKKGDETPLTDEEKNTIYAYNKIKNLNSKELHTGKQDLITDKDEAKKVLWGAFEEIGAVTNTGDGTKARFSNNIAGKMAGHQGFNVANIAEHLGKLYEDAVLFKTEPEIKKDGHTVHPNIDCYKHYLNSFKFDGTEYYVRFTVTLPVVRKVKKGQGDNVVHSTSISEVSVYEKEKPNSASLPVIDRTNKRDELSSDNNIADNTDNVKKFVDEKVEKFLNDGEKIENKLHQQDLGATSWDAAGRATITLMQKADASTLIHESGHVFLEALWNDIQTFHIPKFTFLI